MDPDILALINDSQDAWLAEVPEWTSSQGDELMPSDDEKDLLFAAQRVELYELFLKQRSIITIKKQDVLRVARALIVTKAFVDQDPDHKYISRGTSGQQRYLAYVLQRKSGIPYGSHGLRNIQQMQDYLGARGYQIIIFEGMFESLWYRDGTYDAMPKKLFLLKIDQHFHGVRSVPRALKVF